VAVWDGPGGAGAAGGHGDHGAPRPRSATSPSWALPKLISVVPLVGTRADHSSALSGRGWRAMIRSGAPSIVWTAHGANPGSAGEISQSCIHRCEQPTPPLTTDELLEPRRGPGRPPSSATPNCSVWRSPRSCWAAALNAAGCRLLVPDSGTCSPMCTAKPPTTAGCAGPPLVATISQALAVACPSWCDAWRLLDATPIPCGASRQTVRRSEFAGWAGYGYDRSHSRWYWGLKL
jgi:hypothetical protein